MAGGIWKSARRVRRHCCWEKVWREKVTVMEEVDECIMYWIGKW